MAKLANFEVTLELKELKIHVKGDREVAPSIAHNVAKQFSGMLSPAGLIESPKNGHDGVNRVIDAETATPIRRKKRIGARSGGSSGEDGASLNWTHDVTRWGSPVQTWKSIYKIAWLLQVVKQEAGKKDLSPTEITDVFGSRFREAGLLNRGNIARDLGNNAEFFGSLDGRWFLKQAGEDLAEKLVTHAKGGTPVAD